MLKVRGGDREHQVVTTQEWPRGVTPRPRSGNCVGAGGPTGTTPRSRSGGTAVRRREVKSKGEKERYTHLNAEFQRISRRDMKAFLSDQCKEIEENNNRKD